MIFNKKADVGSETVMKILFIIIVFVVILAAVIYPLFISKGPSIMTDQACHFNAMLDNAVTGTGKAVHPMQLWMCKEKEVEIKGNDWDKCAPEYKELFENGETIKAQKKCATYQIAKLADKCWYIYGQNKWDFGPLDYKLNCFRIKLINIEGEKLNENDVKNGRNAVNSAGELEYGLPSGERYGFPAQHADKHIDDGETVHMYFCDHATLTDATHDDVLLYDCED